MSHCSVVPFNKTARSSYFTTPTMWSSVSTSVWYIQQSPTAPEAGEFQGFQVISHPDF